MSRASTFSYWFCSWNLYKGSAKLQLIFISMPHHYKKWLSFVRIVYNYWNELHFSCSALLNWGLFKLILHKGFRKPKNLFLTFTMADWIVFAISLILFTFLSHFNPRWIFTMTFVFQKNTQAYRHLSGCYLVVLALTIWERERDKATKSAQCHCRLLNSNFRWNVSISLKFSGNWTCILWID